RVGDAGVAAGLHRQVAAAQRADAGEADQERVVAIQVGAIGVRHTVGPATDVGAEVDPPGRGHGRFAAGGAARALAPQPAAHRHAGDLLARVAEGVAEVGAGAVVADQVTRDV